MKYLEIAHSHEYNMYWKATQEEIEEYLMEFVGTKEFSGKYLFGPRGWTFRILDEVPKGAVISNWKP